MLGLVHAGRAAVLIAVRASDANGPSVTYTTNLYPVPPNLNLSISLADFPDHYGAQTNTALQGDGGTLIPIWLCITLQHAASPSWANCDHTALLVLSPSACSPLPHTSSSILRLYGPFPTWERGLHGVPTCLGCFFDMEMRLLRLYPSLKPCCQGTPL